MSQKLCVFASGLDLYECLSLEAQKNLTNLECVGLDFHDEQSCQKDCSISNPEFFIHRPCACAHKECVERTTNACDVCLRGTVLTSFTMHKNSLNKVLSPLNIQAK